MLALPLPILTFILSAIVCALVWRFDMGNALARSLFRTALILITAGQLLVGLRFGYGMDQFAPVQRAVPLVIGPSVYLGFLAFAQSENVMRRKMLIHFSVAAAAAFLPQLVPDFRSTFDILIGLSFLFYCTMLLLLWRKGADTLFGARLGQVRKIRHWMLGAATLLALNLIFDTKIAINFAYEQAGQAVDLISYGSLLLMLTLALFIVFLFRRALAKSSSSNRSEDKSGATNPDGAPKSPHADPESIKLEQTTKNFLLESRLYLDTNLTLERLSKRLHVPARTLSEAINQTQNMNVSQYVNGFRLDHAEALLRTTSHSVKRVMEESGFLTRSNFYREFERVHSQSPLEYRKSHSNNTQPDPSARTLS